MKKVFLLLFIINLTTCPEIINEAVYKIVSESHFFVNEEENCVKLSDIDIKSGFIHLSYGYQAINTVQKFFDDSNKVLLLEINLEILQKNMAVLQVEANKPGGNKFPHLYGIVKIPKAAIKKILILQKQDNNSWALMK